MELNIKDTNNEIVFDEKMTKKQKEWENLTYDKCCHGRCDAHVLFLIIGFILIFYPWIVTFTFNDSIQANYNIFIFYFIILNLICGGGILLNIFAFFWYFKKIIKFQNFDYSHFIDSNTNTNKKNKIKHIIQILW